MGSTLAFHKRRKRFCGFIILRSFIIRTILTILTIKFALRTIIVKHHSPAGLDDFATGYFEIDVSGFREYGGVAHFALGIEDGYEMERHQFIYFLLIGRQVIGPLTGRNDRMVVCYFLVIEDLFRLRQFGAQEGGDLRIEIFDAR